MTRRSRFSLRAGLALALALGAAWTTAAQPPLDDRLDRLAERLSLSAEQSAALDAVAARQDASDPASMWSAAAEVRQVLTAEQLAELREAGARRGDRSARRGDGARGDGDGRRRGAARSDGPGRNGSDGRRERGGRRGDDLTDAQRQAVRTIRDDARTRRQSLVDALRAGQIADQDFADQTEALREETARRLADALPDDARRDDRGDRREAAQAARDQALGLSADQKARLLALRLDAVRQAPERPDLRPYLDADGRLDREAYREATQAQREARREGAQTRRQQAEAVLTAEQRDLVAVHRALSGGGRAPRPGRR